MHRSLLTLVALLGLTAAASLHADSPATQPTTKPSNTMCPVHSDNAVDDRATVTYQGKVIGFCCEDCIPEFNKDPEKYVNK